MAKSMAKSGKYDAVIAIGAVVSSPVTFLHHSQHKPHIDCLHTCCIIHHTWPPEATHAITSEFGCLQHDRCCAMLAINCMLRHRRLIPLTCTEWYAHAHKSLLDCRSEDPQHIMRQWPMQQQGVSLGQAKSRAFLSSLACSPLRTWSR